MNNTDPIHAFRFCLAPDAVWCDIEENIDALFELQCRKLDARLARREITQPERDRLGDELTLWHRKLLEAYNTLSGSVAVVLGGSPVSDSTQSSGSFNLKVTFPDNIPTIA